MKIKDQILLALLPLSIFVLSFCTGKKSDANDKDKNLFGVKTSVDTQLLQPCRWSFTVEQGDNGEATLVSTAKLDSGWHLYSQNIADKRVATQFAYDSLPAYTLIGHTEEGNPSKKYDPYLEMEVLYFEKEAVFKQKIKVQSKLDFLITGTIDNMVCLTQCVNSNEDFSFTVKGNP